jgi:hypothetical protein
VKSTFPPLIPLSGHSPSQEAKAEALAKGERSGPISVNSVGTVRGFRPGTLGKIDSEGSVEMIAKVETELVAAGFARVVARGC